MMRNIFLDTYFATDRNIYRQNTYFIPKSIYQIYKNRTILDFLTFKVHKMKQKKKKQTNEERAIFFINLSNLFGFFLRLLLLLLFFTQYEKNHKLQNSLIVIVIINSIIKTKILLCNIFFLTLRFGLLQQKYNEAYQT